MTVESAIYINGLNASLPASDDPRSEGDDHIRLVKSTLQATWPSISGAVTATHVELNLLDGVTATTEEINKLDGVVTVADKGAATRQTFAGDLAVQRASALAVINATTGNPAHFLQANGSNRSSWFWSSTTDQVFLQKFSSADGTTVVSRIALNNDGLVNVTVGPFTIGSTAEITEILDEDDMSSDSATALVTQQSVKAYAGTWFESAEVAIPTSLTTTTTAHSFGVVPRYWSAALRCKSAEHGYVVGDEIPLTMNNDLLVGQIIVYANATVFGVTMQTAIFALNKTNGNRVTLTPSSWRVVFRANN